MTMHRIVIGVDGSPASDAALRWAGQMARATGVKLTAVHAHRRPSAEITPDDDERMLDERPDTMVTKWIRPVEELGIDITTQVIEGDPRTSVLTFVDDDRPDLLVLGRTGAGGGPGFLHLGSVVEHVAHHVSCPLAVIPPGNAGPIERIVLGVDGSQRSAAAVRWCAELAGPLGAEVVAVTVDEPIAEWTPSSDERNWRRSAERDIAGWIEPISALDVSCSAVASENLHPADGLLGVASARSADLLVIGTRGAGGFVGLRFGGVAMKVLHRASLPVVLVPPGDAS
jgi:nucleotide-binding universal stress UspA family protein